MDASLRRSTGVLAALTAASAAVTVAWWLATGAIIILGVSLTITLLAVTALTPWLSRQEEETALCRACGHPVRDLAFGFCLHCGIEKPLKDKLAKHRAA